MINGLAFLFSFCSFGYQQVLALALYDSTGDFVVSQCFTLATFLFGMCLGSLQGERGAATWKRILKIEWSLSILGAFSVHGLQLFETGCHLAGLPRMGALFFILAGGLVFAIGFLTGMEWPLLSRMDKEAPISRLLAANYMGAFAAAVATPTLFFSLFDTTGSSHLFGILNFIAASLMMLEAAPFRRSAFHLFTGFGLIVILWAAPLLRELHLKSVYFAPKISSWASLTGAWSILNLLGEPLRIRSQYQWIDILPKEFSDHLQGRQDLQLYLDRKLQVSSSSIPRYHQSLVVGGLNLLGRLPSNILILGGGDGLLADEIFRQTDGITVDLVELDPKIIEIAKTLKSIRNLNHDVFKNPRLTVHIQDAFQFLKDNQEPYDLILADFPFPATYELSAVYSKEFYRRIHHNLSPKGLLVFDFPLPGGKTNDLPVLLTTLRAAGFRNPFAFGSEDFFVAVAADQRDLKFTPATLLPRVDDQTLSNLVSRAEDLTEAQKISAPINSVLRPVRFGSAKNEQVALTKDRVEQKISFHDNPGFLPEYLERWETALATAWPFEFKMYFLNAIRENRDFSEDISPGFLWPRFQWGFESEDGTIRPLYQWFDVKTPEKLREAWNASFCVHDPSDWMGVTWTKNLESVDFYIRSAESLRRRHYKNQVFQGEWAMRDERKSLSPKLFFEENSKTQSTVQIVGTWPPEIQNERLKSEQAKIAARFLIWPRFYEFSNDHRTERIYFP